MASMRSSRLRDQFAQEKDFTFEFRDGLSRGGLIHQCLLELFLFVGVEIVFVLGNFRLGWAQKDI